MNSHEGEDAPVYPLSKEDIRRKRIRREKEEILAQVRGLEFERRELMSELRKHQNIFMKRLTSISNDVQKLLTKQYTLLTRAAELLELDGKCAAWTSALVNVNGHTTHHCGEEYGHEGLHHCSGCSSVWSTDGDG